VVDISFSSGLLCATSFFFLPDVGKDVKIKRVPTPQGRKRKMIFQRLPLAKGKTIVRGGRGAALEGSKMDAGGNFCAAD